MPLVNSDDLVIRQEEWQRLADGKWQEHKQQSHQLGMDCFNSKEQVEVGNRDLSWVTQESVQPIRYKIYSRGPESNRDRRNSNTDQSEEERTEVFILVSYAVLILALPFISSLLYAFTSRLISAPPPPPRLRNLVIPFTTCWACLIGITLFLVWNHFWLPAGLLVCAAAIWLLRMQRRSLSTTLDYMLLGVGLALLCVEGFTYSTFGGNYPKIPGPPHLDYNCVQSDPIACIQGYVAGKRGLIMSLDNVARALYRAKFGSQPTASAGIYSLSNVFNPFFWNYWLALAYIFLSMCLVTQHIKLWRGAKSKERTQGTFGLFLTFVVVAYLVNGILFGFLYHSLFLDKVAQYNWFVWASAMQGGALREERLGIPYMYNSFQHKVEGLAKRPSVDPVELLASLRISHQSSAVFAQDQPTISFGANGAETFKSVFEGTFQFDTNEASVVSEVDLTPSGKPESSIENRKDKNPARKNGDVERALELTIKSENDKVRPLGRFRYRVSILASASKDSMSTDAHNDFLARQRAEAVRAKLSEVCERVKKEARQESWHVEQIEKATDQGIDVMIQAHADAGAVLALWNNPERIDRRTYQAARLTIDEVTADPASSVSVEMSLAKESTLLDFVYFSFVAFTTSGYGDIRPVSPEARFLTIVENILEVIFTSVFFAILVSA